MLTKKEKKRVLPNSRICLTRRRIIESFARCPHFRGAIRLATFFKTSPEFWMNLQMTYDLRNAEKALPARVRKSIENNRSVLA